MEMGSAPSKDRTLADEYAGLINLFFQRLRQNLNSPEVKNKIRQRNRTCREAYMGGIELVKNLFPLAHHDCCHQLVWTYLCNALSKP